MSKTFLIKLTKWIIIPLAFLFSGVILSFVYFFNSDINPNVISINHSVTSVQDKGGVVSGTFTAQENYLGVVTVRFDKKEQLSGDSIFRIKNVLDDDWYHTATISAEQYYTLPFYSFGFPVIEKSKNQTYQFQIKLLSVDRGLALSRQEPVFVSNYAYPKEILLGNFGLLKDFAQKKIDYYFSTQNYWKVFFVYSLPLLLYLLYILALHRFISDKNKNRFEKIFKNFAKPTIITILVAMAIDIFVIRKYTNSTTSWLTLLWILGVISYRLEAKYSFGFALIFLTFCPFLLVVPMDWVAEKSAIWAYMMLIVGTLQLIFESSPIFQKMTNIKFAQLLGKLIRLNFLIFDRLIKNLLNFFKQIFIKKLPTTFIGLIVFLVKLFLLIIFLYIFFIASFLFMQKLYNFTHL